MMPEPVVPVPKFSADVGFAYIFAKPQEVRSTESRFASSVGSKVLPTKEADTGPPLMGEARGVGGVVEILRAKYGCSKGQRMRCLGETPGLLKFEAGRMVPKNHEGSGFRWVLREEEEAAAAGQAEED